MVYNLQNDIWQTQSWSSIEWSGQWKLLHYYIRRTYNHILISPLYVDGRVSIYVVVDVANYDIKYDLQVSVITWASVNFAVRIWIPMQLQCYILLSLVSNILHRERVSILILSQTWRVQGSLEWRCSMKNWRMSSKARQLLRASYICQSLMPMVYPSSFNIISVCTADSLEMFVPCYMCQGEKAVLAENLFFPANFTDVNLPEAKLTAADFKLSSNNKATVSYPGQIIYTSQQCTILLYTSQI